MKRRVTYITAPDAPFDPAKQGILSNNNLAIRELDAAKEERFTFALEELPTDLSKTLHATPELRIRWSTRRNYDSVAPFLARISPGLHVHVAPSDNKTFGRQRDGICPLLKRIFGSDIECLSEQESFSEAPVLEQSSSSQPLLQFYHSLPSIVNFVEYIQQIVCESTDSACVDNLSSLSSADFMAVDYDATTEIMSVSVFWSQPPDSRWSEDIKKYGSDGKVEIGLLSNEKATDAEDISLGGFLTVVGKDTKLKPTLFSFPSRHHALPGDVTYVTSFEMPTGLHPTLKIAMPSSALSRPPAPEDTTCTLHTYLTLPSTIFADRYQLSTKDHLFLSSHNLVGLRAVSGETDLEAPDWVLPRWGSNLLIELAIPSESQAKDRSRSWDVTIPLHLRYLKPSEIGVQSTSIPWPTVFWACTADDGTEMGTNPFDRVNLGYDALFPTKTFFYHLHPATKTVDDFLVQEIQVPVLQAATGNGRPYGDASTRVELGTVAAILIGFTWVLWKLWSVFRTRGLDDASPTSKDNKKER